MAKTGLVFRDNNAGEEEGLGHPGIETYKDTRYPSVARECGQNTADASVSAPAILRFDLISIPRDKYPSHAQHLAAVTACLKKARKNKNEKEVDFFERAKKVLEAPKIKILRIADYNTTGLTGPAQRGTPFHALLKGSGVSDKPNEDSGGSFGIGKNAAFAVSELQTVFYSTVYRDPKGKPKFLAQGKTILVSHTGAGGRELGATGYWGRPDFDPIDKATDVPSWMRRNEVGTSLFVIGFGEAPNWQLSLAASVLQNFFCAIHRGTLEFEINDGAIKINRQTLEVLFSDSAIAKAADDNDRREEFEFSRALLDCLLSPASVRKEVEVGTLGRVAINVLVREHLPKRVCIVRNGMTITDNLAGFGDKFATFPLYKDFVALVEPLDKAGSTVLKRLENPRHDGLSAERLADEDKRTVATRDMKHLAREIRNSIKEQALVKPTNEEMIDELSEFFGDLDTSRPPAKGADENPETYRYERVARREAMMVRDAPRSDGNSGGSGNSREKNNGRGPSTGQTRGRGAGGGGPLGSEHPLGLDDFRNIPGAAGGQWDRRLFFTARDSCKAMLTVHATGLEQAESLRIVGSDLGQTSHGRLLLDLSAGQRIGVNIRLSDPYTGPLELTAVTTSEANDENQ